MPPGKKTKRFPVGLLMKEKKDQKLELVRKRASLSSEVNNLHQKVRRLEAKVTESYVNFAP